MGGATIWPIPRAIDAEAHYYPRKWKRNLFVLYSGALLISFQINRYGHLCRVSVCLFLSIYFQGKFSKKSTLTFFAVFVHSNRQCALENTWTGDRVMLPNVSVTTEFTRSEGVLGAFERLPHVKKIFNTYNCENTQNHGKPLSFKNITQFIKK